jgi:hypothetical protein
VTLPFYVEFPTDPVVGVHWKKKDEPPDPGDGGGPGAGICGEGQYGFLGGTWVGTFNNGYFTLYDYGMYELAKNLHPTQADQPYMYFPAFVDYVVAGLQPWIPFVWAAPRKWTVKYEPLPGVESLPHFINIWYNVNPQVFASTPTKPAPDLRIGDSGDVEWRLTDSYPPIFGLSQINDDGEVSHDPYPQRLKVQAHCTQETTGALPPQPDGWGTEYDPNSFTPHPLGSTNDPLRPSLRIEAVRAK